MIEVIETLKLVSEDGRVRYLAREKDKVKIYREKEYENYIDRHYKVGVVSTLTWQDLDIEVNEARYILLTTCFEAMFSCGTFLPKRKVFEMLWKWTWENCV